ncbi:hypothetical protein ST201phi2-1p433 [Pseudomonas phage 201phi2-1]|uniref:Uncharacterized protein n=1 Tax=Pseudomonas phage 201phi2-1 TaxID=198110 RepID=B3FJU1_BP201|nr:hypothetical protein ST201phi2-1p433 [Pseudomonas phage 201phi2-1]ABY63256.1 hypothetical protein 201phi2-1p433 [Pseudomonas phage 201phi2-1]
MIDDYIAKHLPKLIDEQLKVTYPYLTKGRRDYIARKCITFFEKTDDMVYGSRFETDVPPLGEFYKVFKFKIKRKIYTVGYSVG